MLRVAPIKGRGLGVRAAVPISRHQVILEEQPLLVAPADHDVPPELLASLAASLDPLLAPADCIQPLSFFLPSARPADELHHNDEEQSPVAPAAKGAKEAAGE